MQNSTSYIVYDPATLQINQVADQPQLAEVICEPVPEGLRPFTIAAYDPQGKRILFIPLKNGTQFYTEKQIKLANRHFLKIQNSALQPAVLKVNF